MSYEWNDVDGSSQIKFVLGQIEIVFFFVIKAKKNIKNTFKLHTLDYFFLIQKKV